MVCKVSWISPAGGRVKITVAFFVKRDVVNWCLTAVTEQSLTTEKNRLLFQGSNFLLKDADFYTIRILTDEAKLPETSIYCYQ